MARSPAGCGSGPPLAAPAIHTGMLRSGTKSSPITGAGRERCLEAPGLDFALSRRKQGFESPWARHGVREFESSQPSHPVLAIAQSPLSREKLRNSAGLRGHLHAETENSPFSVKFGASNRPQSPADILKSPEFG